MVGGRQGEEEGAMGAGRWKREEGGEEEWK
jgi:hypothetical protein